ncbi:MAG: hypothetical protein QW751_02855 [Candidatus Aenigmatarchaeota archaeon]|nr:hypothetical protein [Candidatus Aenigmarchaeota archaeon]
MEWRIESEYEAERIVTELQRRRKELLGKEIDIERRYPRLSAGYHGRLTDIQEREGKLFLNVETRPGEVRSFLVGSREPRTAKDIVKHIERTRIKIE